MPRHRLPRCLACARPLSRDVRETGVQLCRHCLPLVAEYEGADAAHIRRTYGLTISSHARLYALQGGKCAICERKQPLVVDHDHVTGEVRGLLCGLCNSALGFLRDIPEAAIRAANYLQTPPAAQGRARMYVMPIGEASRGRLAKQGLAPHTF